MYFGVLHGFGVLSGTPKPWNWHISVTIYRFMMNQTTHFIGDCEWPFVLFSTTLISLRKKLPLDQNVLHALFWEHHLSQTNIPIRSSQTNILIWPLAIPCRMSLWNPLVPCVSLFNTSCQMLSLWQDSTVHRKWKYEQSIQSINCVSCPEKWPPVPLCQVYGTGKHVVAS